MLNHILIINFLKGASTRVDAGRKVILYMEKYPGHPQNQHPACYTLWTYVLSTVLRRNVGKY
jgi:hypothetical protein